MPSGRYCTVCRHPKYREITKDILNGVSVRALEGKYQDLSKSALDRHVKHVPRFLRHLGELEREQAADALVFGTPVLDQIRRMTARVLRILERAEETQDHDLALEAIREYRKNLEFTAKLTGELDPRSGEGAGGPLQVTVIYADKALVSSPAPSALPEPNRSNGGPLDAIAEVS